MNQNPAEKKREKWEPRIWVSLADYYVNMLNGINISSKGSLMTQFLNVEVEVWVLFIIFQQQQQLQREQLESPVIYESMLSTTTWIRPCPCLFNLQFILAHRLTINMYNTLYGSPSV